uniref:Uncharacterized protein n=1 Tax=Glossina pallidipes TaxID=7398 RepID=A0A1B0AAT1_GLOPL
MYQCMPWRKNKKRRPLSVSSSVRAIAVSWGGVLYNDTTMLLWLLLLPLLYKLPLLLPLLLLLLLLLVWFMNFIVIFFCGKSQGRLLMKDVLLSDFHIDYGNSVQSSTSAVNTVASFLCNVNTRTMRPYDLIHFTFCVVCIPKETLDQECK